MRLVSVITPGRGRVDCLARCVASVQAQSYPTVEHILVSDGCDVFGAAAREHEEALPNRVRLQCLRESTIAYRPARAGFARNAGVDAARGEYVAFLDDDNTWEPDHLSALVEVLESGENLGAAFSYRRIWTVDGMPYLEPVHPWTDVKDRRLRYAELAEMGVYEPGTNAITDLLFISPESDRVVCTVDTSAWLLRSDVAREFRFRTDFCETERSVRASEDALLGESIVRAGVRIARSGKYSLNYFLGGFSTSTACTWSDDDGS